MVSTPFANIFHFPAVLRLTRRLCLSILVLCALTFQAAAQTPISAVDTSLVGSQKYLLRVAGTPYFLNAIQLRCDKLRYFSAYLWNMAQCNALAAQAASDGFNTLTVPLMWYEVEPTKDSFDWTILNDYLAMASSNHLKLEFIWEGTNNDGATAWEGDSVNPVHLRVPDYVLFAPSYGSTATTSDYRIVSGKPYTLDLTDSALQARETYVLGKVVAQIAAWDAANGNQHPVVGFQLNNEPQKFSDSVIVSYLSGIASAIKQSSYSVWTRSNTVDTVATVSSRISVNNSLRAGAGTNLDFIGIDNYSNDPSVIQSVMPAAANNFAEIMENGGANSAAVRLAALAGNTAFDTYDLCGPDGHGLYKQVGSGTSATFTPSGSNITEVRGVLHMLDADPVDLALNANGQGLFVHNWEVNSTSPTTGGTLGITYTPVSASDEGISIQRGNNEVVLMSVAGGTFTYPSSLGVTAASTGHFDSANAWVSTANVPFTSTSITLSPYGVVRLTLQGAAGAETLQVAALAQTHTSGVSYTVYNGGPNGQQYGKLLSTAVGQEITYTVTGLVPNTSYNIAVGYKSDVSRGQAALSINGSAQPALAILDEYAATSTWNNTSTLGTWTAPPSGSTATFTFTVAGLNAAATGYTLGLEWITLTPAP